MGKIVCIHAQNPQRRFLQSAVQVFLEGGVVVYPTDTTYALGCQIGNKKALERIIKIRQLPAKHQFTILCRNFSEIADYAHMENWAYRLLKSVLPGPYTFIMKATKSVPKRLLHPKRKTIGLRIPDHILLNQLLARLPTPILTSTLVLPESEQPMNDPDEIFSVLGNQLDLVIDGGLGGLDVTSVIDLTMGYPQVLRRGLGDVERF